MLRFDRARFAAAYSAHFPKPVRTPQAVEGLNQLLAGVEQDAAIEDLRWVAYMLATIKHECANTWAPITERGPRKYFDKYETGTTLGSRLGNTQPGDGYLFRGRGYVQITGRRNYQVLGQKLNLGHALVQEPERALEPEIAYRIMSFGMRHGSFTGRRLAQVISSSSCDYKNARKIINGLDQADRIAAYAQALEQILGESQATASAVATPTVAAAASSAIDLHTVPAVPAVQRVEPVPATHSGWLHALRDALPGLPAFPA